MIWQSRPSLAEPWPIHRKTRLIDLEYRIHPIIGSADDGADPSTLELVVEGAATAAAGFDHGLVVQQGKLFAFGPAHRESTEALLRPIAFDAPVSAVAAGEHHTLILTTAGNVYTFGSNREGQLGTSVGDDSANPVLGLGPGTGSCYSSLAAPVVAIAAGARHSVAVNSQGQCLAWGWSLHGQCGTGEIVPSVPTPTVVSSLGPLKCKAAAAGSAHTLCLTDGGDVYTWGSNADGALGLGDADSSLVPQLVEGIEDEDGNVVKVTAGARHSVAVCSSGKAFSWG